MCVCVRSSVCARERDACIPVFVRACVCVCVSSFVCVFVCVSVYEYVRAVYMCIYL